MVELLVNQIMIDLIKTDNIPKEQFTGYAMKGVEHQL